MRTSEVLNRAADLIEERGWVTGSEGWGDQASVPLCLEGGIRVAAGIHYASEVGECAAAQAVRDYLALPQYVNLYDWNDDNGHYRFLARVPHDRPERAASEVIEVLRATAVIEAARESELAEVSA